MDAALKKTDEYDKLKIELEEKISQLQLDVSKKEDEYAKTHKIKDDELDNLRRDKDLFNMETEVKNIYNLFKETLSFSFTDIEEKR